MVAVAADPVLIRGPKFLDADAAPLLLERTDPRFMSNVRDELAREQDKSALKATIVKQTSSTLKLFQPVHRTFYIVLTELVCDVPGKPRLDPAKVDSAGLVVRRVQTVRRGVPTAVYEGWMQSEDGASSWSPIVNAERRTKENVVQDDIMRDDDPDAARRRASSSGSVGLDERLARLRPRTTLSETVTDLFVLPPKVTQATHATLLFGALPTTSLATSKAKPTAAFDDDDAVDPIDMHEFFGVGQNLSIPFNRSGSNGARFQDRPFFAKSPPASPPASPPSNLTQYSAFLQQAVIQYDILGDSSAAQTLRRLLNKIELPFVNTPTKRGLADHLQAAARVLVLPPIDKKTHETPEETSARLESEVVEMPTLWFAALSASQRKEIRNAIGECMRQRLDAFNREESQFAIPGDRFQARAFVRVRRDDGCPPDLFWTAKPTAEFEIAPWFETGPAPMPVVQLPDPFAPGGLARFKPNVGFALPSSVVDVVRDNSPDALIKGQGNRGNGLGIGWLCGFNIPLITLCAFIVLSIFLSLFQIIFWWLAFIKICIPIPKRN